ncbi:MAG: molybdopterin-guanine dinucleotide biosynthesis protein B [Alphaproteobacteria bacterium]|nr:molybdopterin-guanine dinucleotide biosynthesis protein B [Alphaproteobacteria bacterium]
MRVIGLAGASDDDRVALAVGVVSELTRRGFKVSVAQRASRGFDVDRPGKDSDRHRAAGATEVMVTSANRWALIHQRRPSSEARVADLTAHMSPADLLIADGFVDEHHPCLELHRSTTGTPRIHDGDSRIVAVASDIPLAGLGVPVFDLGDHPAIADFILGHCRLDGGQ